MAKRLKVLFTIPNFETAGSGRVVHDLVKGLDKTQFAPEICCFHDRGTYFETIKKLDVPIHFFEFASPYRPFISLPFRIWRIAQFYKQHEFDLIHSWHWSSDFTEPLAAKLAGIPYVYTKKAMGWGNRAWLWRSKLSTQIIAINTDMIDAFFRGMEDKVDYIPLGVDTKYFKPFPKSYRLPDGYFLSKTDFVIVTVANLVPVKGVEVLLDAVRILNDCRIKVFVVGSTASDYAQGLIARYADEQVFFVGKQHDVRPYLAEADVFVLPTLSIGEGLPIAPLEAMASGKLVIGSRVFGITDILKDFEEFLFTPGDSHALAEVLKRVMNHSKVENELWSQNMRQFVTENLSLKKFLLAQSLFYTSLVNK